MNGNGCAGSTASGVSTGKIALVEVLGGVAALLGREVEPVDQPEPRALEAGEDLLVEQTPLLGEHRPHRGIDGVELLARGQAVGGGLADVAGDLLLEPADPLHEELVEVAVRDGDELEPLEQRVVVRGGLGEDPPVELEPRQLAVE
jgi:hypothetical protein